MPTFLVGPQRVLTPMMELFEKFFISNCLIPHNIIFILFHTVDMSCLLLIATVTSNLLIDNNKWKFNIIITI